MKNSFDKVDKTEIIALISGCPRTDFDGHTEFNRLSPRDKILWLSNTVYFLHTIAKNNPKMGCNDFFSRKLNK
jgi:hypothetical protein